MCTSTVPHRRGRKSFPYKTEDRVQDEKRDYHPNDDYTFVPLHILHPRYTAGSGFPHSRQNSFERDVINPQDGHILWDPKPAICGFSLIKRIDALKFLNERATNVGSVRKRGPNGRKTGSIDAPSFLSVAQRTVAEGLKV